MSWNTRDKDKVGGNTNILNIVGNLKVNVLEGFPIGGKTGNEAWGSNGGDSDISSELYALSLEPPCSWSWKRTIDDFSESQVIIK